MLGYKEAFGINIQLSTNMMSTVPLHASPNCEASALRTQEFFPTQSDSIAVFAAVSSQHASHVVFAHDGSSIEQEKSFPVAAKSYEGVKGHG